METFVAAFEKFSANECLVLFQVHSLDGSTTRLGPSSRFHTPATRRRIFRKEYNQKGNPNMVWNSAEAILAST